MAEYCKNCKLLLITARERKIELCRFCEEKFKQLPKIGVVLGEQLVTFEKDYFRKK